MLKSDSAINSNFFANDFASFDDKIWLNSASEGALPLVSYEALLNAGQWKLKPFLLTHARFAKVPAELKKTLAQFLNADADDIILGNSATYGIQLLAQGLPLKAGEEVLLMQNDFPSDILPWLHLEAKGIQVRQLLPRHFVLQPEEIFAEVTAKTKVICLPHVHTFSGNVLDIKAIGEFCQSRGIIFIVNGSQSVGYWPIDLKTWPIDALISAGFKWLCGPYGTGFCWIRPEVRESLECHQSFWVNVLTPEELNSATALKYHPQHSSKAFDVFGTANFFNYVPWTKSVEYLSSIGITQIANIIDSHIQKLIAGFQDLPYNIISDRQPGKRSALFVFSHQKPEKNDHIFKELQNAGIYLALWKGNLRISPHLYNTGLQIETTLKVLRALAS